MFVIAVTFKLIVCDKIHHESKVNMKSGFYKLIKRNDSLIVIPDSTFNGRQVIADSLR